MPGPCTCAPIFGILGVTGLGCESCSYCGRQHPIEWREQGSKCQNSSLGRHMRPGLFCCSAGLGLALMALDIRAPLLMAQPPRKVDFAHDIVPLLKARCGEC